MATDPLHRVVEHLRGVFERQHAAKKPDGELLKRYVRDRDAAAFEAIVRRHGPMVLGVCRRVLRNLHDAEDAFQATYLVLVRKAATLRSPATLGNWLYGVAYRTALHARDMAAKRRAKEASVAAPSHSPVDNRAELRALLDQELERVSDKYRTLIVLCDLEGKTRKEAAAILGVPEGTVASRLAKARLQLAKRLARHGLAVSGGTLATALSADAAGICVPISLIHGTSKAALALAAGSAAGAISGQVMALTQGVLKMMLLTKLKNTTAAFMLFAVLSTTAAGVAYKAGGTEPGGARTDQAAKSQPPVAEIQADKNDAQDLKSELNRLKLENGQLKVQIAKLTGELVILNQNIRVLESKAKSENQKKAADIVPSINVFDLSMPELDVNDHASIMNILTSTVEPMSWAPNGTGSIEYFPAGKCLIVRNVVEIQDQVRVVLERLLKDAIKQRKAITDRGAPKVYPVPDLVGNDGQSLITVIKFIVQPNSWEDRHGTGTIVYFPEGKSIVVSNSAEVQVAVQSLLTDLRKAKAEQEKKNP